MTPEEVLRDLRDIHLPGEAADAAGTGLVLWPVMLVLLAAAAMVGVAWRRRSIWRRDVARTLDAIERHAVDGRIMQGWSELAVLLRRLALGLENRRDIAGLVGDDWLATLDRLLDTDMFSEGAGRGVIVFPYREPHAADRDDPQRIAADLKATIGVIRENLPRLRMAA